MNKVIQIAFIAITVVSLNAYSTVRQITENLYTARIPGKNLSLVMERIDDRTQPLWLKYISIQVRASDAASIGYQGKGTSQSGSLLFKNILEDVSYRENEIWVAYITRALSPEPIPDYMANYKFSYEIEKMVPFAKDIEMFVTVTSRPKALITSHFGIANSAEAALQKRTKGISVDLHSFAAKVMLARNPERKYMVNAPVFVMEKIIIDALPPTATFVGTKELLRDMLEKRDTSFDDFKGKNEAAISKKIEDRCKEKLAEWQRLYEDRRNYSFDSLEEIRKELNEALDPCLVPDEKDNAVLNLAEIGKEVDKTLAKDFFKFKNPYIIEPPFPYVDVNFEELSRASFELLKNHPPVISADYTKFIFFDKKQPWLIVRRDVDKDYQWLFHREYRPKGVTHYFVVDLKVLANSKAVEDLATSDERKPYQRCPHCGF